MSAERPRLTRFVVILIVTLGHLALLFYLRFTMQTSVSEPEPEAEVIKLVDYELYIPPPPPPPPEKTEIVQVSDQPAASEQIIEVEEEVIVVENAPPVAAEPDYLPQHKISRTPVIPFDEVDRRTVYPPMALRQEAEGLVYVELFIDAEGLIRKAQVLKDPGHGFAEAALAALEGIRCQPAEANGVPVPVRYRYVVRFNLN